MSERPTDETRDDTVHRDYDTNPAERGKWVSGLVVLAGVWLILEALLLDVLLLGNFWNDIVVGALLIVLGGYNYYRRSNEELGSTAAAGLTVLLGLWLVISPFVYAVDVGPAEITTEMGFWNDVIVGLIVAILGAYSVYETRDVDVRGVVTER